ncbi:MAG: hypothetical protein PHX30_04365 [Candidatus Pacebacteria bacterium]|nr:hypothetical protein [Candidatus Paceibacterota bacterium]
MLGRQDVIEQIIPIHQEVSRFVCGEFGRITKILSGFNGDKKVFAEQNRKDLAFGIVMSSCEKPENLEKLIKEKILKATKTQKQAVEWLEERNNKVECR